MVLEPVLCPTYQSSDIIRHGLLGEGKPCYKCRNSECQRCTFMLNYTYRDRLPEVKQLSSVVMDLIVNQFLVWVSVYPFSI